jgi:hypothetical protein
MLAPVVVPLTEEVKKTEQKETCGVAFDKTNAASKKLKT